MKSANSVKLEDKFKEEVRAKGLFTQRDWLLLAVSGGVDSVVMCELCRNAGYDFRIAHCNFQLRQEESLRDEEFVASLGNKYGVEIFIKRFETEKYASQNTSSVQESARSLRYEWFSQLVDSAKKESPAPGHYLLTAHHAGDNIETLLMNFFRGTGLHGLTGIPQSNAYVRRPLLEFTRAELIEYANEKGLDWVEDSSNLSVKYTRNYFRNELIPAVSKVYPGVEDNLAGNIRRFREIEKIYRAGVEGIKKKICRQKGKEVHIPVLQLLKPLNRALVYEIISPYGFQEKQVDELIRLAGSASGRYISSPKNNYRIIKHRHWFIISPSTSPEAENFIIEKAENILTFAGGQLRIREVKSGNPPKELNEHTARLDLDLVEFPLLLRRWKKGDYFYPLGMRKKKKLSRFFIDQKLSTIQKENAWVLQTGERITWIVGMRIDDRFKISDSTRNLLEIQFLPSK